MRGLGLAILVFVSLMPKSGQAAELTEAIYDDAKAIITDLIETEAVRSLVPALLCSNVNVHLYLGPSLQRMYTRRFEGIGAVMLGDVSNLMRDWTLWALEAQAGDVSSDTKGERFSLPQQVERKPDMKDRGACIAGVRDPKVKDVTDEALMKTLYGEGMVSLRYHTTCRAPKDLRQRIACELADGVAQAINGNGALARYRIIRMAAAAASGEHAEDKVSEATGWLARLIDDPGTTLPTGDGKNFPADELRTLASALGGLLGKDQSPEGLIGAVVQIRQTVCAVTQDASGICDDTTTKQIEHLSTLYSAVSRRDFVAIIESLITLVAPEYDLSKVYERDDAPQDSEKVLPKAYVRFLLAVASYAFQARDGDAPSAIAREALRSTAMELLESTGQSVPSIDRPFYWKHLYVPQPTLRLTMSAGYVDADKDGLRAPIGLDWLALRARLRYTERSYVALNIVVVDILAPFAEFALRDPTVEYAHEARVWATLLSPRVELLFGVPAFSRHLFATVGVGVRLSAPSEAEEGKVDYTWITLDAAQASRHVEGGVGVKYLF